MSYEFYGAQYAGNVVKILKNGEFYYSVIATSYSVSVIARHEAIQAILGIHIIFPGSLHTPGWPLSSLHSDSSFSSRWQSTILYNFLMQNPKILLSTNLWDITIELFPKSAPKAVENFSGLVKQWYYDGIIFHRVIRDFMIQSGDPTGTGRWGKSLWFRPFEDEFDRELTHKKWVLSMANAGRNTNGSQFFIVTSEDASFLDGKHSIFGHVIEGMDIVDEIERLPVDGQDKPKMEAKIVKATLFLWIQD